MPIRQPLPRGSALLLSLLVGCAAAPTPTADAEQQLVQAEALVAAGEWQAAQPLLQGLAGLACPKRLQDRRDLATATDEVGLGQHWQAYELLERFPDLYPHSELRPAVVETLWDIGSHLASSGGGFLFFWSDRRASRTVLEHLITRHPDSPRRADALRLLGDMAFEDRDYELAQERYRDLMLNRPDSEWFVYAQFRFAMSVVESLQGPDYDLNRMQHAVRELRDFLATKPENPELAKMATEALARVLEWQADRHLRIAAFYHRVGNAAGERYHLEIAAGDEFADTPTHARAVTARDELPPTPAATAAPATAPQ